MTSPRQLLALSILSNRFLHTLLPSIGKALTCHHTNGSTQNIPITPQLIYSAIASHSDAATRALFLTLLPINHDIQLSNTDYTDTNTDTNQVNLHSSSWVDGFTSSAVPESGIGSGGAMEPSAEDSAAFTTPTSSHDLLLKIFTQPIQYQNQLNQSSWYMNDEKVTHYARLFASGEFAESNIQRQLLDAGIRPYCFYGCVPSPARLTPSSPPIPYVMFKHEYAHDGVMIIHSQRDRKLGPHDHLLRDSSGESDRLMLDGPNCHCQVSPELTKVMARFSVYGPTLFTNNHPVRAIRLFRSTLIDAATQLAALPTLPVEVIDIIVDYTDMCLPYIESEAKQQLSQWAESHPHSSPSYSGQTNNPVETPVRLVG